MRGVDTEGKRDKGVKIKGRIRKEEANGKRYVLHATRSKKGQLKTKRKQRDTKRK